MIRSAFEGSNNVNCYTETLAWRIQTLFKLQSRTIPSPTSLWEQWLIATWTILTSKWAANRERGLILFSFHKVQPPHKSSE